MRSIQDIRPGKRVIRKVSVEVEEQPLDKAAFTAQIHQLSDRFNYPHEQMTARERFLRTVRRHNRFAK